MIGMALAAQETFGAEFLSRPEPLSCIACILRYSAVNTDCHKRCWNRRERT